MTSMSVMQPLFLIGSLYLPLESRSRLFLSLVDRNGQESALSPTAML